MLTKKLLEVRVVLPLTELTERDTRRALRACNVLYLDVGAGYTVDIQLLLAYLIVG